MTLSATAQLIKHAYVQHRRMVHPNYKVGDRWDSCWERAAKLVNQMNYDIETFMACQFDFKRPFPMPSHLYTEQAVERMAAFGVKKQSLVDQELVCRLDSELGYMESRLELGVPVREIIDTATDALSATFRCCAAAMFQQPDLEAKYFEEAWIELAGRYKMKEVYRDILPEGLR